MNACLALSIASMRSSRKARHGRLLGADGSMKFKPTAVFSGQKDKEN